jgi:hypothetical protein
LTISGGVVPGDLGVGGGDVGRRVEEDLDDAERRVRVRLDMFDVIDGRRQSALEGRDDASGHLVRLQTLVLPRHADDGDVDGRENIHGHAHGGETADEQDQNSRHDERVRPTESDTNYCEHVEGWSFQRNEPLLSLNRHALKIDDSGKSLYPES